jgi:AraC-like DNA-binding protein
MNAVRIPVSSDNALPMEVLTQSASARASVQSGVQVCRLAGTPGGRLQTHIRDCPAFALLMPETTSSSPCGMADPDCEGNFLANFESGASLDAPLEVPHLLALLPFAAFDNVPGRWQIKASPVSAGVRVVADDQTMRHLCLALLSRPQSTAPGSVVFERSLTSAMLAHFLKQHCPVANPRTGGAGIRLEPWQLRVAEEAMLASLDRPLRIPVIASRCGVSVVHFSRAFRRTTSETPCRWLMRRRIERACAMLVETRECIADIALACGFSDQSHLTRTFSTVLRTTPGAWRASQRVGHK